MTVLESNTGRNCRRVHRRRSGLPSMLRALVLEVRECEQMLMLRTRRGAPARLAAPLERHCPEVLCAIAGADALMLLTATSQQCGALGKRIRELMN